MMRPRFHVSRPMCIRRYNCTRIDECIMQNNEMRSVSGKKIETWRALETAQLIRLYLALLVWQLDAIAYMLIIGDWFETDTLSSGSLVPTAHCRLLGELRCSCIWTKVVTRINKQVYTELDASNNEVVITDYSFRLCTQQGLPTVSLNWFSLMTKNTLGLPFYSRLRCMKWTLQRWSPHAKHILAGLAIVGRGSVPLSFAIARRYGT